MNLSKLFFTLLVCSIYALPLKLNAQLINKIFEQKDTLSAGDTQSVRLNIELFNYYRNTEYFDIIEKGQTFFGSMFQAHLSYQPYKNVLLKGGIQTRQDYGSTGFIVVQPVFGVSIFKDKWRYNLGLLQGNANYGFIEPMYNIDKAITHRIENGLQGIYKSKNFYFNNFLVWNEATYRTTKNQERFTTGFVGDRILKKSKWLHVSFPFQGTLAHRGGQLNDNPNRVYSRVNTALGLKLNFKIRQKFEIRTESHWLHSEDFSPSITQPYKNGNANWHSLSLNYNGFEFMFNYWAGREYQSPVGTQIYNNYNIYNNYEHRRVRHMLMGRFMYTQAIEKNMFLDFRLEPFYDYEYKRFQYSYSIYLKLNFDKFLGKI
jgi:hypothetical protein